MAMNKSGINPESSYEEIKKLGIIISESLTRDDRLEVGFYWSLDQEDLYRIEFTNDTTKIHKIEECGEFGNQTLYERQYPKKSILLRLFGK